jgi:hypothetical protein
MPEKRRGRESHPGDLRRASEDKDIHYLKLYHLEPSAVVVLRDDWST